MQILVAPLLAAALCCVGDCFNLARSYSKESSQMEITSESAPDSTSVRNTSALANAKCWYLGGECSVDKECCGGLRCTQHVCKNEDSDGSAIENFKTSTWLKQMGLQKNRPINPKQNRPINPEQNLKIALVSTEERRDNIDERGSYLGGDMRVRSRGRIGVIETSYRWESGIVPYVIDEPNDCSEAPCNLPGVMDMGRFAISKAMEHIQSKTCIKFTAQTTEEAYIYIVYGAPGSGCWSWVGRLGYPQKVNLGPSCFRVGTIVHELMHALGFEHEHTRPDRDDFITIQWTNVDEEAEPNFGLADDTFTTMGFTYDYGSIMHYSAFAFAVDRTIPTIIPKKDGQTIGQRLALSDLDAQKINKMYDCSSINKR